MKCPVCGEERPRNITVCGASVTDRKFDAFYDKDDKYHRHDKSTTTTFFKCHKGHVWSREEQMGTCECGWRAASNAPPRVVLHKRNKDVEVTACESG